MAEGTIYILTNQAMPGYVKVGKTLADDVNERIRQLSASTSIPLPFDCFYAARVPDVDRAEALLHDAFGDHRPNPRREFFTIDPERVRSAVMLAAIQEVTPGAEEVIPDVVERAAVAEVARRKRRTSLADIGIVPGEMLVFDKDESRRCTVLDEWNVDLDGEERSLSRSALMVLHQMGYEWPSANGWDFWTYGGRKLSELVNEYVETG